MSYDFSDASIFTEGFPFVDFFDGPGAGSRFPTGADVYRVGDQYFLVYEVKDPTPTGGTPAVAHVYFHTSVDQADRLGHYRSMSPTGWAEYSDGYVAGGPASIFDTDASFVGRSWEQIVDAALDAFHWLGTDATEDQGIMDGLAKFISDPMMGDATFEALWVGTDWYQRHTEKQREWTGNLLGRETKDQRIIDAAIQLLQVRDYYTGEASDLSLMRDAAGKLTVAALKQADPVLHQKAFDLASGASTQPFLVADWIKPYALTIKNSPHNRRINDELRQQGLQAMGVAEAKSQITDLYERYGLDVSNHTIEESVQKLYMNQMSLDEVEENVKDHSLALYPNKPINMDWATYAKPFRDSYATILETSMPGFRDSTLATYLQNPATDSGEAPNLYEFEKLLRKDPRWEKTKNARDEYHSAFGQIGRLMGLG